VSRSRTQALRVDLPTPEAFDRLDLSGVVDGSTPIDERPIDLAATAASDERR
jgi:hypothetical protein